MVWVATMLIFYFIFTTRVKTTTNSTSADMCLPFHSNRPQPCLDLRVHANLFLFKQYVKSSIDMQSILNFYRMMPTISKFIRDQSHTAYIHTPFGYLASTCRSQFPLCMPLFASSHDLSPHDFLLLLL